MLIRPILLSGGSGTRLWPASRKRFPKQFAPLVGEESLFTRALLGVADRSRFAAPLIIGNIDHKFLILDTLERLEITDARILLEPEGRNTAAAALVAALAEQEPDITHLVLPSDHVIEDRAAFHAVLDAAAPTTRTGLFVLFGIQPTHPETGFGYIRPGAALPGTPAVSQIAQFCEKPDAATAARLIQDGALWNSGIFFYAPQTLLDEAAILAPDHLALCAEALAAGQEDLGCLTLGAASYAAMKDHPFDRLIMERTQKGAVAPCSIGWSDLGSWQAMWQMATKDENQTAKIGPVVALNTHRSYIRSYGPTVAVSGLNDMTIVATKDAVLVMPTAHAQDIKALYAALQEKNEALALEHPQVLRPWGSYERLAAGERYQVKHIIVAPGKALSAQMHHHRAEHWVVVEGTAKIQCGDKEKLLFPNESLYIPGGTKHRLSNPGKIDLHLIEVQSGDYLGEDDIVRFDDAYGRA